MHAYWAHLGKFKIAAEISPDEIAEFWAQDSSRRAALLQLFRKAGTVAVLAHDIPSWADKTGWVPVGHDGYWLFQLAGTSQNVQPQGN